KCMRSRDDRLLLLSIAFPPLATMLHGFGDFPFHVASTTTIFTVFLGMVLALPRAMARGAVPLPETSWLQRKLKKADQHKWHIGRFATICVPLLAFAPVVC